MGESRIPISVVIPTRNEAANIAEAVRHVVDRVQEVIVADNDSTDETVALAEAAGARVMRSAGASRALQLNAAIAQARCEWVLTLDADERVTPELLESLARTAERPAQAVYEVQRLNHYLGRPVQRGTWGRDWVARLFPRDRRFTVRRSHAGLPPEPGTGRLEGFLVHHTYADFGQHIRKFEHFARSGALDLHERGKRAGVLDLVGRPAWRFFRAYVLERRFLDGRLGLVTSGMSAVSAFLKYAYLWSLEERPPDAR